jgi:hypothetical protein
MSDYFMKKTVHKLTVGLVAVKFPTPGRLDAVTQPEAIFIQGIATNTGRFHIGGADVQTDYSTPAFIFPNGYADAMLPYVDEENLWVRSTVAGQTLMITYLADKA